MSTRILHCLRAPVGGLFRHVRDLSKAQKERGAELGVVCDELANDPLSAPRLAAMADHLSLGLTRLPMSRGPSLRDHQVATQLVKLAVEKNIDILHGHGAKGGAYARLAARSLRRAGTDVTCIYTPHGGSLHFSPTTLKGRIYMGLERYLARHTDGIAFESAYSRCVYGAQIGLPSCPTAIIPNGLLPEEFDCVSPNADANDFLFIGELRHLKGVDVLLRALAILNHDGARPASATIVGAGPDEQEFRSLCDSLNLNTAVTFAGARPAAQAFTLGRALVMPSRAESFPYIILEAAAAGLPLLASNVGGIPEIVDGTDTALLPPGNVQQLSGAMAAFLANPGAASARAQRLKHHVGATFTVAQMADGIDQLYRAAM